MPAVPVRGLRPGADGLDGDYSAQDLGEDAELHPFIAVNAPSKRNINCHFRWLVSLIFTTKNRRVYNM